MAKKKLEPLPEVELTREQVLQADDLVLERVSAREWGGYVYVLSMTYGEREAFENDVIKHAKEPGAIRGLLLVHTVCNKARQRLFKTEDFRALNGKRGSTAGRCYDASIRLNKITAEDIDELEKN